VHGCDKGGHTDSNFMGSTLLKASSSDGPDFRDVSRVRSISGPNNDSVWVLELGQRAAGDDRGENAQAQGESGGLHRE
jgi:hypothetical protein